MLPRKQIFDADPEAVFDALGNPIRRQIVAELGGGPLSVGELADRFAITRPAISRHLAVLEAAALVRHDPAGTRNVYRLDNAGFERTNQWLGRFWDEAEARLKLVAQNLASRAGE